MENKFSFPVMILPPDSDQFEFGPVTLPGSPASPADHLFSNGKLLPHVFPTTQTPANLISYSRSTSRTSSKGSLMSSRSNSTNSRSSNCSSARTSTSEATERRSHPHSPSSDGSSRRNSSGAGLASSSQYHQYHGSSRRWQLIAGAPVLMHQGSRSRSKVDHQLVLERNGSKKSRGIDGGAKSWFGSKILKSLVSACKECHAIKT